MQTKSYLGILLLAAALPAQTPPAHPVFDQDAVHEIRLRFEQPDYWQQLTDNYENNDDVPYITASLEWGEWKYASVGVRFKGNSSYRGATTKKKPFRIKLNEFVSGQKISGMASFGLSNAWSDPSFVREKPYYELAAAAGLKAARSNFAALYINDEYWGLYVLGEIVNGDFLKAYFGKGDDTGNLYKASDPGAALTWLGEDKEAYKSTFEKQSNEDADDWTDFIDLVRLLNQTSAAELKAKLDPIMDVDSVLTALALDNLTVNLDSYVGMAQNYYLYHRPSDNRWVWIPWDPSLAFGGLGFGVSVQQMKELPLEWVTTTGFGAPGGGAAAGATVSRPLASKLWQVPEYKARYREIYQQLMDKVFFPEQVLSRMNTLRAMIQPWVVKDTQKLCTQEQFDQAMTTDTAGGGTGGGGTPPNGPPTTPPNGPPTTPPNGPPTTPPTGPPTGPGAGGAGGTSTPGLEPFINARVDSVKSQLAK
jgi:spore coat protein CotH